MMNVTVKTEPWIVIRAETAEELKEKLEQLGCFPKEDDDR